MNEKAIYSVRQHGRENQFYSYCAGGFSYPFHVADWLHRADQDLNENRPEKEKLSVAALLPQLTGDYNFPEAAKGLHLFRSISDSEAAAHLGRTAENERIPFHVTLDLDRGMVCFAFNHDCPELDLPDFELPMRGGHEEMSGLILDECAHLERLEYADICDSPFMTEVNEAAYEQIIREYIAGQTQPSMGMRMG